MLFFWFKYQGTSTTGVQDSSTITYAVRKPASNTPTTQRHAISWPKFLTNEVHSDAVPKPTIITGMQYLAENCLLRIPAGGPQMQNGIK